jgi:hypothetical protein
MSKIRIRPLLACALLLVVGPAWGAITAVGSLGSKTSSADNETTGPVTTGATLEVGSGALVCAALNNTGTTDADHSEVTSVTDTAGNTYSKQAEFTNGDGAADAGVTISAWITRATNQLDSGQTITVNFANAIDAYAIRVFEFALGAAWQSTGTPQSVADDDIDPSSLTIPDVGAVAETLFIRCIGEESGADGDLTPTTNYTTLGHVVDARSGTGSTGIKVYGEYRIGNLDTDTSDPSELNDADHASVYFALRQAAAAAEESSQVIEVTRR